MQIFAYACNVPNRKGFPGNASSPAPKIATLYSPLKLLVPTAAGFGLLGVGYYAYTYLTENRFTNMSALLLSAAVIVFLVGLVSEQITALTYRRE